MIIVHLRCHVCLSCRMTYTIAQVAFLLCGTMVQIMFQIRFNSTYMFHRSLKTICLGQNCSVQKRVIQLVNKKINMFSVGVVRNN